MTAFTIRTARIDGYSCDACGDSIKKDARHWSNTSRGKGGTTETKRYHPDCRPGEYDEREAQHQ